MRKGDSGIPQTKTLFFELLKVSVGSCLQLSSIPSNKEWLRLYALASKQALIGVCFHGVKQLPKEQVEKIPLQLKMLTYGTIKKLKIMVVPIRHTVKVMTLYIG